MGAIDEYIEKKIHESVKEIVAEIFEPVLVLRDFQNVDVLTFDEVCKVLRLADSELDNAIRAEAVPCLKLGKPRSTWRFSKYQIAQLLIRQ